MRFLARLTPNQLTLARLVAAPLVAILLCVDGGVAVFFALLLYVAAAITDWLDGYLARKRQIYSGWGAVLDPVADKLLVQSTLLALAYNGRLNALLMLAALIIIAREVFVAGLREYAGVKHENVTKPGNGAGEARQALPVTVLAKLKTALQLVALGLLIPAPYLRYLNLYVIGGVALWVAAGLSVYTAYGYWQRVAKTLAPETTPQ